MAVGEQEKAGVPTRSYASNVRKIAAFAGGYAMCAVVAVSFSQAGHAAALARAEVGLTDVSHAEGPAGLATLATLGAQDTQALGSLTAAQSTWSSSSTSSSGAVGGSGGSVAPGSGLGLALVQPGTGDGAPLAAVAEGPGLGAAFRFADDALFSSDPGIDGTFEQVQQIVQTSDRLLAGERGVVLASGLIRPIDGPVTSVYGMRFHPYLHQWRVHTGIDLGASCGTPVRAAADGTVTAAGWNTVGYGNQVVVDNGKVLTRTMSTTYNHLSAIMVNAGDVVRQGQIIGLVGTTGWSTGCHLHFEVLIDGVKVDPAPFLDLAPSTSPTLPPTRPGRDGRTTDPTVNPAPSTPSAPVTPSSPATPAPSTTTPATTPATPKPPNPTPSVPGTTTPVTTTPGTSGPGTSSPGTSSPGTSSPGTSTPGTTAPGITTPGTTTPGTATPGASTPATTTTTTATSTATPSDTATTTASGTTASGTGATAGAQSAVGANASTALTNPASSTTTSGTTTSGPSTTR